MSNVLQFPKNHPESKRFKNAEEYTHAVFNELDGYVRAGTATDIQKAVRIQLFFILCRMAEDRIDKKND